MDPSLQPLTFAVSISPLMLPTLSPIYNQRYGAHLQQLTTPSLNQLKFLTSILLLVQFNDPV